MYVQGLPDDITEIEFTEMMAKCGLIAYDYEKKKQKIKLYLDKDSGKPKGDGLCTYIKVKLYPTNLWYMQFISSPLAALNFPTRAASLYGKHICLICGTDTRFIPLIKGMQSNLVSESITTIAVSFAQPCFTRCRGNL